MKTPTGRGRRTPRFLCTLTFIGAAISVASPALAQSAPKPPPTAAATVTNASKSGAVVLSPFEVNTARDTSYGALNSNAISAFNMELFKTPVAADILTEDFMRDVATTSVEDLLANYGAGFGEVQQTPDAGNVDNQPGDRVGLGPSGSRGVLASDKRRNGFSVSSTNAGTSDTFDTERVEVVKGANALLFGSSGAGGFINTASKQARFGRGGRPLTTASITSRVDQFGSKRWEFDANYGVEKLAFRFVLMNEDRNSRRLYIGAKTDAFYGTLAARLPFNTTLSLTARKTDNDRINQTSVGDLSFTNATRDPRHNFSLMYLLATNQAGATNPKTGAAYPGGAIANGKLTWDNASSWGGWAQQEDINTELYTLTVDTVWTKWLATSLGAMYDFATSQRGAGVTSLLAPRSFNTANPLDEWANGSTFAMNRNNDINAGRRHAYRASAVATNELFNGKAKSQTVLGYDLNFSAGVSGVVSYVYYEADANFRVYDLSNPRPAAAGGTTGANQLGRIGMGTLYWPVGNGPVKKPFFRPGARQITANGRNYVLLQQNPQNPNFVSPLNPLGLVSLVPGFTGVGGNNLGNFAQSAKDYGLYGANYTRWLDDRFTTLLGYRFSNNYTRRPNTVATGTQPWTETDTSYSSYNLGLTYRLKPWLNAYYNAGRTFLPFTRLVGDPYGEIPKDTDGFSHEIGFKYQPASGIVSGSISYYRAESKHEPFNFPAASSNNLINPAGLNDAYNPALRGTWVSLDKKSSGLEVILTAAPTRNWRARLGFTQQDGKILTTANYPMLWNDEFAYNKATGGVTYTDGTPFIVPTDAAGIATVNATTALRAPVVGATNSQLTVAMMSDPNSPYYAYGQGGTVNANGQITANSVVFRALRWFQVPSGGQNVQARTLRPGRPLTEIPYAYGDPAGYKGIAPIATGGEPTLGHPLYRFVCTNTYDISEGWLRGATLGGTVRWDLDKRTNWYTEPDGKGGNVRKLYKESAINPQVNPFLSYRRKIGRTMFRTQVNVNNVFNNYKVELRPSATSGYTVENAINATFVGQPREYVWTNTVSF